MQYSVSFKGRTYKKQRIQTVQSQTYSTINPDQPCMVKEQHIQVVYE
jgi:hypothetical protein